MSEVFIYCPLFLELCVVVPWILSWGCLLSCLTRVDGDKKVMFCPGLIGSHEILSQSKAAELILYCLPFPPAVLIAWPTYDCDTIFSPHDTMWVSIWHSMINHCFSSSLLPPLPFFFLLQIKDRATFSLLYLSREQKYSFQIDHRDDRNVFMRESNILPSAKFWSPTSNAALYVQ